MLVNIHGSSWILWDSFEPEQSIQHTCHFMGDWYIYLQSTHKNQPFMYPGSQLPLKIMMVPFTNDDKTPIVKKMVKLVTSHHDDEFFRDVPKGRWKSLKGTSESTSRYMNRRHGGRWSPAWRMGSHDLDTWLITTWWSFSSPKDRVIPFSGLPLRCAVLTSGRWSCYPIVATSNIPVSKWLITMVNRSPM